MRCRKCGGLMAHEKYYGQDGDFFGWRCISCGDIIDEVILENRQGKRS